MVRMGAQDVTSEDEVGGNSRPLPGRYHATINGVKFLAKDGQGKNEEVPEDEAEKIVVTFEVLAGTVPGQDGREIQEYFAVTDKAIARLKRLALCVGILKPQEAEKDVQFSQAQDRQLVIEIEENSYEKDGKTIDGVRVAFMGMWSVFNQAVSDVPKNKDILKMVKEDGSVDVSTSKPSKQSKPSAEDEFDASGSQSEGETVTAGGGSDDDKWSDL